MQGERATVYRECFLRRFIKQVNLRRRMKKHMTFRRHMNVLNRASLAVLVLGVLTPLTNGQTNTSLTLRLNVLDTQGSVVPGATVVLNREAGDHELTGVTTDDGTVTFVHLEPGTRKVTVKATGFTKLEQRVTVRANERNDLTLSIRPTPIGSPIMNRDDAATLEHSDAAKDATDPIVKKIKSLRPNLLGRFIRGFQYQYQISEQRAIALVELPLEGETVPAIVRNPEKYLQKHTVSFKFSELFPDRLPMFKRGTEYANADAELKRWLCDDKPLITCLTKRRGWKRVLMATSLEIYFSERQGVQEGRLVTSPRFGHDYQFNGGFVFDPAKLFPTATDWKATFDAVQGIDTALAVLESSDLKEEPWKYWFGFMVPKIEFKILSQFDFVKFNGVLIRSPIQDRALTTFTLTWDLARMIPDTKTRLDASALIEAVDTLKNNLGQELSTKQCVLHFSSDKPRRVDVKPTFSAKSCERLAELYKADRHELDCKGGSPCGWKPEEKR